MEEKNSAQIVMEKLNSIDMYVRKFVEDIIKDSCSNYKNIYIKTGFDTCSYTIALYNSETKAMKKYMWLIEHFLNLGANNSLEIILNTTVKSLLLEVNDPKKSNEKITFKGAK